MSTITLNGNTLSGRLGIGSYMSMGNSFSNARSSTSNLSSELGHLRNKIDAVNTSVNVDGSQATTAKTREENKSNALTCGYDRLDTLVSDVGVVDNKTATEVEKLKKDFYKEYSYLKPDSEKSWWDKVKDRAGQIWDGICDIAKKIDSFRKSVVDWCKKHWKAIVTAIIVIVAIVLICTGVGGPLGAAAIGALIGAGAGGIFGGVMSAANGGSFWEGFENGAFSGAISGAITGAMSFGFVGASGASLTFGQTVFTGATSSGGASLLSDLGDKFIKGENISFGDILKNTLFAIGTGAALSAISFGAGKLFSSVKQKIFPSKDIQNAPYIKDGKPNGRPSPSGKAKDEFLENLYEKQVGADGMLKDPHTGEIIPWKPGEKMKGIVDIGHKTGKEYTKAFTKYQSGKWTLEQLKAFQSNPKNFYKKNTMDQCFFLDRSRR